MSVVTIGGIEFLATGADFALADRNEVWICSDLRGWDSGAPMRGSSEDYPNADGASPLDVARRSARPLKFLGAIYTEESAAKAAEMRRRFAALQSSGAPIVLSVEDDDAGDTLTVTVSIDGTPEVRRLGPMTAALEMNLIAYDPVKYGVVRPSMATLPVAGGGLEYPLGTPSGELHYGALGNLGRVTLTNDGTATVWPTVSVTGELTLGFFIQKLSSGEVVRYDRIVPLGSTVAIDFRTGEVVVDGASDGSTYLTRDEFFSVMPGESFEVQFNAIAGSSGVPQMTVSVADGYW